jgi:hypothetical protein
VAAWDDAPHTWARQLRELGVVLQGDGVRLGLAR